MVSHLLLFFCLFLQMGSLSFSIRPQWKLCTGRSGLCINTQRYSCPTLTLNGGCSGNLRCCSVLGWPISRECIMRGGTCIPRDFPCRRESLPNPCPNNDLNKCCLSEKLVELMLEKPLEKEGPLDGIWTAIWPLSWCQQQRFHNFWKDDHYWNLNHWLCLSVRGFSENHMTQTLRHSNLRWEWVALIDCQNVKQ